MTLNIWQVHQHPEGIIGYHNLGGKLYKEEGNSSSPPKSETAPQGKNKGEDGGEERKNQKWTTARDDPAQIQIGMDEKGTTVNLTGGGGGVNKKH